MNILIIGTGYVGTTTGLVFAEFGHMITGLDVNEERVRRLSTGYIHFYEPGLQRLLEKHLSEKSITFTTDYEQAVKENEVIIICVGTPSNSDGSADLSYIQEAAMQIGRLMNGYKLIVNKSTVPVGTQEQVTKWILGSQKDHHAFDVVSNPEFLSEGKALDDALNPDRIIIGSKSEKATLILKNIYQQMTCPIIVTKPRTAELIKYASNSFLATKISYINELSKLCDKLGVDVQDVASGMGYDQRIGRNFLNAGIGFGGSCFPKDLQALIQTAKKNNMRLSILEKVDEVNHSQYLYFIDKLRNLLSTFQNKKIALLGLSFKPHTDDLRKAPALSIIKQLLSELAVIHVHDPIAKLPTNLFSNEVHQFDSAEIAARMADAIIISTEWPQYKLLDWKSIHNNMKTPYLFDGRNLLDAKEMNEIGFYYQGVGYR